jgi:prepilin-type N-terminal cleavage/methylation domain-containing protein
MRRPGDEHDAGLGLIEVIVALMILAVLAVALLPVLSSAADESSTNIARSTASQLTSKELNTVRAIDTTCAALHSHGSDPLGLLWTDPRGTILQIHRVAQTACPGTYPALMDYRVYVTEQGQTQVLSDVSTKVYISAAN